MNTSRSSSSGLGNNQMPFDFSKLRNNISRNLQEVVNDTLNSESVMDFRKMLKKSCSSCGNEFSSFSFFSRSDKKRCQTCMMNFCTGCMFKTTTPRKCRRCLVFNQTPLTKEGLNSLRVRDLKWYLARRNISSETYSEKRELVDLIILTVRRPSAESNNVHNSNGDYTSTNQTFTNPPTSIPTSFRNAPERSSFSETPHSSSVPSSPTRLYPDLNEQPEQQSTPVNSDPAPSTSHQNDSRESSNLKSTAAASTPNLTSRDASKFEPFNLEDISEESEINNLSIRQLKIILARNYVDFRGCIEREELVKKTILLWNDHQSKQKYMQENEDNLDMDADACKICMTRPIDCVLLECGHMVTCTDCGKVLPECPICRQFVSRVVHVFKS